MELRHLQALVAVADELNFSRAAERLNMAQSPLSQRIRSLEAELGIRLFERTNRRVTLTDAGERVLAEARTTLQAADAARRVAARARDGDSGRLRIGFVASAAFLRLPELLAAVQATLPDVEIELIRLDTAAQTQALAADSIDLGLARARPPDDPARIQSAPLEPEPFFAALPTSHPLASDTSPLALTALAHEPWILSGRSTSGTSTIARHITGMCQATGFEPRIAHIVSDLPSVLGPVAGGLGVTLAPLGVAQLNLPGVTTRALIDEHQRPLHTTLLWHPDRKRPAVRRALHAITT